MSGMREQQSVELQLKQMNRELNEIKTAQPISGDGWISYKILENNNNWDITGAVLTGSNERKYKITFTPEEDVLVAANIRIYYEITAGGFFLDVLEVADEDSSWWVKLTALGGGATYNIKFVCISSHEGTLSHVTV